jgi:hypothetical protein
MFPWWISFLCYARDTSQPHKQVGNFIPAIRRAKLGFHICLNIVRGHL